MIVFRSLAVILLFLTFQPLTGGDMHNELYQAFLAKGKNYVPRTDHLKADGSPEFINRLILSDSPYLIQHAHNPVNWFAWGDEAFVNARKQNKLIFLSVGYATCHWCHVMEKESFENLKAAEELNSNFISIKVDREQHPQVDSYYMSALTFIQGHGGWPMSVFLLPDGGVFHAATYLPPEEFISTLKAVNELWQKDSDKARKFAANLAAKLEKRNTYKTASTVIDEKTYRIAANDILAKFEEMEGGFSSAPKFPHEPLLFLLQDFFLREGNSDIGNALFFTLDAMARGGIYDQAGGGFHRYSTDNSWLVPHFEKMLYNQAMLARIYLNAYRATGVAYYRHISRAVLDYVVRDLTDANGGFYAATDADSGEGEGEYFTWTIDELRQVLPKKEAEFAVEIYNLSRNGNFEGRNILHLITTPTGQELARLAVINRILLKTRNTRPLPLTDTKIITAWNGLMITAFAEAYAGFGDKKYLHAAEQSARRIWENYTSNKELNRIINSKDYIQSTLNDYVFLTEGFIALYDAGGNPAWLERARELTGRIDEKFAAASGGYYINEANDELGRRVREDFDGAIYSPIGVLFGILVKLYNRTGDELYQEKVEKFLADISGLTAISPQASAYLLTKIRESQFGETGLVRYGARGNIKMIINSQGLRLEFADNWHINADKPGDDSLIATQLLGDVENAGFPAAKIVSLNASGKPLALIGEEGQIRFTMKNKDKINKFELTFQACNDKICLAPEKHEFIFFNLPS